MSSTAFPAHNARVSVVFAAMGMGLALAIFARVSLVAFVASVLLLGIGLGLAGVAALDRVRGPVPSGRLAKSIHLVLRVPVLLFGIGAVLLGPVLLGWGTWAALASHSTAGASTALLAMLLLPSCVPFGVEAIRATLRPLTTLGARRVGESTIDS